MIQTTAIISFSIVMKLVDILKKGLQKLCDQTYDRKVKLEAELKANRPMSEVDEEWLDHTGNLVAEERVVEKLDKTLDYDALLKELDQQEKFIVQKLTELGNGQISACSKKQKSMAFKISISQSRLIR